MTGVRIFPLVPNVALPTPATATTRKPVPKGYGVQEQCLPFTAATALGLLVRSPITFGLCPSAEIPAGGHPFRSPLDRPGDDGHFDDDRVFYVKDDARCRFADNAYRLEPVGVAGAKAALMTLRGPGISFFDREDQQEVFKLHLPFVWRTPSEVDTLFLPLVNRGSTVSPLSGLVETSWYASPVNLVLQKPPAGVPLHVETGEPVAQAILVSRSSRRPEVTVVPPHARDARELRNQWAEWRRQHGENRSAYKRLARSHHGRAEGE